MFRNKSARAHSFAMVPRADIPRSKFRRDYGYKTTFDSGYLIPIFVDEVLPGDSHRVKMTAFTRLATPIVPVMDNLHLESFFFFVPNRLLWSNWEKFMGEQDNPADSISYVIPQIVSPSGGHAVNSIYDYMGLPTAGQVTAGQTYTHSALPLRAYNLIYNEWFRDQNLQNSVTRNTGDGPDAVANYALVRRGKRHDYFTSCLPWTQKGTAVPVALTGQATVKTSSSDLFTGSSQQSLRMRDADTGTFPGASYQAGILTSGNLARNVTAFSGANAAGTYPTNLYADLSTATSMTVNALRQSFQIQKLLERDARGGTRYTEIIRAHFGVVSPDARLQRPEYLGGGHTAISINPVSQTTATGVTGSTTPIATQSAFGTAVSHGHGFSQSFTEHGYVIGLVSVRADLTYQQGLPKMWSRSTRYDFYFPVFAALGEQAVLNQEIYCTGTDATDAAVFGYQERWAEYRYKPSQITGLFRSTSAGTLDVWHLSQRFLALPTLNATFIEETPPVSRILATSSTGKEFLFDAFFDVQSVRPLPAYSVPGLIDHF